MVRTFIVALMIAGSTATGAGRQQPTAQVVQIGVDEIRYTYDPARLKPYVLEDVLLISPFSFHVPQALELCVDGDPDYRPCGDRALGAENFLANAAVNLAKGQQLLSSLDRLKLPVSLGPPLRYYRRGVVFWLCLERARLAFYRGDNDALRATCDSVDASAKCPGWVRQASISRTNADRDQLAKHEWHNCMNNAFHEGYGEYPIDAWRAFLKEFAIEETVITPP